MRLLTALLTLTSACSLAAADEPITPKEFFANQESLLKMESVTLKMLVKSTGGRANCYLNSETRFTEPDNFTIFIPEEAKKAFEKAGIEKPQDYFKSKSIRVTGKIELAHNEQLTSGAKIPRITVKDPSQIKILK